MKSRLPYLINGENRQSSVRLEKQISYTDKLISKINNFCNKYFYVICVLSIILCLIVFMIVCYLIVGVSATESGTVYNHMEALI